MPNQIFIPNISVSKIRRHSNWFQPQTGWYLPSAEDLHYFMTAILLCPACLMVYNPYVYPYKVCNNCNTMLELYRGPLYGKLYLDEDNFVSEMITNQDIQFSVVRGLEGVTPTKVNVVINHSWPSLAVSYSERLYEGFFVVRPRNYRKDYTVKNPMGKLLTPLQASFYERYSVIRKGLEEEEKDKHRNRNKSISVTKTFLDLYELEVFDVDSKHISRFKEGLTLNRNEFFKRKRELILKSI